MAFNTLLEQQIFMELRSAILHTFGIRCFSKENHKVINQRLTTVLVCGGQQVRTLILQAVTRSDILPLVAYYLLFSELMRQGE